MPSPASRKASLGQFYTRAYEKLLDGFAGPPPGAAVVEPFAGAGHLVAWARAKGYTGPIEAFDIDPAPMPGRALPVDIVARDTLRSPPDYAGRWVLTNPPYLAKNKTDGTSADLFDRHGTNDLYKVFFETLLGAGAEGGLVIVPINFWSSVRPADGALRGRFLEEFEVLRLCLFEERVFEDTSYAVCAFAFARRATARPPGPVRIAAHVSPPPPRPNPPMIDMVLDPAYGYRIGGELWELPVGPYRIGRLREGGQASTRINLHAIDGGRAHNRIRLVFGEPPIYGKETDRAKITLCIEPAISEDRQMRLVEAFAERLGSLRDRFHSLFLVQYRDSKEYARKRIPFELAYRLVGHLLWEEDEAGLAGAFAEVAIA